MGLEVAPASDETQTAVPWISGCSSFSSSSQNRPHSAVHPQQIAKRVEEGAGSYLKRECWQSRNGLFNRHRHWSPTELTLLNLREHPRSRSKYEVKVRQNSGVGHLSSWGYASLFHRVSRRSVVVLDVESCLFYSFFGGTGRTELRSWASLTRCCKSE